MTRSCDILIIGAGIAGASIGWHLARAGRTVLLLEREDQPGYHATGRSAALFSETYGPVVIRRLSTASRSFLESPPEGFATHPLLEPLGMMVLGGAGDAEQIRGLVEEGQANGADVRHLDEAGIRGIVPIIAPGHFTTAAHEPGAMGIDVAALHQGFLRGITAAGGAVEKRSEVVALDQTGTGWQVNCASGATYEAPIVVNAAGAWADEIARMARICPIGLVPRRRTAVMIDLPEPGPNPAWPLVGDLAETFYFKPDAGRLLLSPADRTPVPPQDVQPEIEDVATVLARFEEITGIEIPRPGETWAGLRSFVADGDPVAGYAPDAAGFFWLAGQGGYGIQTAFALGEYAASLLQHEPLPARLAALGLTSDTLAADRAELQRDTEGVRP